jgi:hypothetical protein
VAIVQISQITNRKGLQQDLPQLAGAELGWSTDARRLWIGNGTIADGAPVVGNTEILTEFSDILELASTYTYKGEAAGYTVQTGPTPGTPISQSLQSWFDQWATVTDFGAIGNGVTDDTDAINRALQQIYCREVNPQIRRALFFPAGVYRITGTIFIPPYATLYGEGKNNSVIQLDNSISDSTLNAYVARTCDSQQQYGANIGANGATAPQYITVTNLAFRNLDTTTNVFLCEDANNCRFQSVGFYGPATTATLTVADADTSGVRFASTPTFPTTQIVFDDCEFSGTVYGMNTATEDAGTDQFTKGITVSNSMLGTLYNGIVTGTETPVLGGTTGLRIINNVFDNIYAEGIVIGSVSLNATGYNIFYDVGNHFQGLTDPFTACIDIQNGNNVSIGDMFARTDQFAGITVPGSSYPRVTLNNTNSIAITNSAQIAVGTYVRESGRAATLINNTSTPTTVTSVDTPTVPLQVNAVISPAVKIDYNIIRSTRYRTGTLTVASDGAGALNYTDDYTENADIGVTLLAVETANVISVQYTTVDLSANGTMTYSISHL